jgi:vitamin B12 transporter
MSFQVVFPLFASAKSEEENRQLRMFFKEDELQAVSATRSLKPISRVAKNMTVITAEDIERMNAHTLDEVLNTLIGIQIVGPRTPGNSSVA